MKQGPRPWVPAELERAIEERAAHYRALGSDELEAEVRERCGRSPTRSGPT